MRIGRGREEAGEAGARLPRTVWSAADRVVPARAAAVAALLALGCGGDEAPPPPEAPRPDGVYGQAPAAVGGVPSVVTLEPVGGTSAAAGSRAAGAEPPGAAGEPAAADPRAAAAPPGGSGTPPDGGSAARSAAPVLDQFGLTFSPGGMVVRVGEPFTVTNSEQLPHNVTIRSGETDSIVVNRDTDPDERFPLALERPGPYHVTCNVHPGMTAFIFATEAPYGAVADAGGSFVVEDVPPGAYTLVVWSADASLGSSREIDVTAGSTEVVLEPGG